MTKLFYNMYLPKNVILRKKKRREQVKFVAPPKEMLLSFLIVQFLTNYDIINRNQYMNLVYSSVWKGHKGSQNWVNRDYWLNLNLKKIFSLAIGISVVTRNISDGTQEYFLFPYNETQLVLWIFHFNENKNMKNVKIDR